MVSKYLTYSLCVVLAAFANTSMAQHNEVIERFTDSGTNEPIFKRFYVLSGDANVPDGFYREVSEKDILLLEGTYANGRKTGKWVRFFNNESEQLKETHEFFDEKFEAEQITYSNTGSILETGKYKCDSKGNLLFKIGEWRYFKQSDVLEKLENYDSGGNKNGDQIFYDAKGKVLKIDIYSANSLVKTKDKFDFQKEQILDFNAKLENVKSDFSNLFKTDVSPILKEAKAFGKLDKSESNYLTGERILEKMQNVHAAMIRFYAEEKILAEQYSAVRDKYINAYSPIFLTEIKRINDVEIPEYKKLESITERTVKGLSLITKLNDFNVQFGKLRNMDSQIEKLANITNKYSGYPALFNGEIKVLNTNIAEYKKATTIKVKLDLGTDIVNKLQRLDDLFPNLAHIDASVKNELPPLYEQYKVSLPSIYKEELRDLKETEKLYINAATVNEKADAGQKLLNASDLLKERFNILVQLLKDISAALTEVKAKYKTDFPEITNTEIKDFDVRFAEVNKAGFTETMLNSGSTLLTDIQVAIENFPELLRMLSEIDINYRDVVNSYKTEFPAIFKVEVKNLELSYLEWKNIGNSSNKLEKAQQILSSIKAMQFNFPMLKEQSAKIEDSYTKLVDFYKKTFPTVYETEVITLPIDAYRAIDNSTKKLEEGMVLLDKADRLGQFYKVHLDQKALITDQMVRFTENYKKNFPVVFKFENERLTALKTTYELVGHSESKIEKANLLLTEAQNVNSYKSELENQVAELALKNADFESKFKKNKQNAVLYKKAKMMYKVRFKEFADEGSAKTKVEKGRKLIGAMAVVISKYTTDNTMLCKTLKDVKTANEVEALLGIR